MHRRTLLGMGAALAAIAIPATAGCTAAPDPVPPTPSPEDTTASVDTGLRASVAAQEIELLARYDATIAAHPTLAAGLAPWVEQHRAHRAALEPQEPVPATEAPTAAPVPSDPAAAVAELIAAERAAAEARTVACEQAQAPDLARLLALIAASEASHAEALATGGGSA